MMHHDLTRRAFLASSSGAIAALAVLAGEGSARADPRPMPTGPVSGRVGPRGIRPGTSSRPSRGEVILLDGRAIEVAHATGTGVRPGGSVLIAPEPDGSWSILYAELGA